MSRRSIGSKLGAIAGLVIMIGFFLPWVKACNQELTGYDIATNSNGMVEDAGFYWTTFAVGAFCVLMFAILRTDTARRRIGAAGVRFSAGLIGFLPLLNIWNNVQQKGGAMEVLYGGWTVVAGYVGIALSFFVDLMGPSQPAEFDPNASIPPETPGDA